ncbi:MAG: 2-isopropylmalate synthase [Candidatus Adiutrix sp.]|jgi:2-isopropylmalate synthase|nr:2-isopropylmalate synthase [Candidatus Adiutrix sp.]
MFDPDRVTFFDTTLRDGEQAAGVNLNAVEKLQIAKQLAALKIDVIESGFPASSPGDFECVQTIAREVQGVTVCGLARTKEADVRSAGEALKSAERSRIHVFIATSPIHMTHKLKMTPDQVLEEARTSVALAGTLADEVEFSAEDASRSDLDFLIRIFKEAAAAGAAILNIPDTVGYAVPEQFARFVKNIIDGVAAPQGVIYSVHAHNDLGLAVANSLAAVRAGVRQVEGTINGMGERGGNAAIEEVVMALKTRADIYGLTTGLETTRLYPVSRLVSRLSGVVVPPNKAVVGANAFAHEAGIHQHGVLAHRATYEIMKAEDVGSVPAVMVLGKHSGRHAFRDRLETLGYQLDNEQLSKAFDIFKRLCDEKKDVTDGDIEAIISDQVLAVTPEHRYELRDYAVGVGAGLSTATVVIYRNDTELRDAGTGNGPIDAAYNAIKRAMNFYPLLENFSIRATSPRSDALGETIVELRYGQVTAQGRGAATDVVKASIQAYINAVNRLYTQAAARAIKIDDPPEANRC